MVVGCGAIFKIDAWKVAFYIVKLRDKLQSKEIFWNEIDFSQILRSINAFNGPH